MKNLFYCRRQAKLKRLVYLNVEENQEYKNLKSASETAPDMNQKPDDLQAKIYQMTSSAEQSYKAEVEKKKAELKKPEQPAKDASQEDKNRYRDDLEKYNKEKNQLETEAAASFQKITLLRDSAVHKMRAAFEARNNLIKRAQDRANEKMADIDPDAARDIRESASFAADAADDGVFSSTTQYEVNDYLTSRIVKSDGTSVEITDSNVEDIAQGIVAVLHNREAEAEDKAKNPARQFMKGLSDREQLDEKTVGLLGDAGVRATDIQHQLLKHMGVFDKDHPENSDNREWARNTQAGKLIADVMGDAEIAPQLRGMLLGKLAGASPKEREEAIKSVQSMYGTLKQMQKANAEFGTSSQVGGFESGYKYLNIAAGTAGAVAGAGATIGLAAFGPEAVAAAAASLPWAIPAALGALAAGSYASGVIDEDALENSAIVFKLLEDQEKVKKFYTAVAGYETFKSATGSKGVPEIDELIKNATSPGTMLTAAKTIEAKLKEATDKYKNEQISKLKSGKKYTDGLALFKKFGVEASFPVTDKALDDLKKQDLAGFKPGLAALEAALDNAGSNPALAAAAEKWKNSANADIREINDYQSKYEKNKKNSAVSALPQIGQKYSTITASEAVALGAEKDKYKNLAADAKIAKDNKARLDEAIASKGKGGGGGAAGGGGAETGKSAPGGSADKNVDVEGGKVEVRDIGLADGVTYDNKKISDVYGIAKNQNPEQNPPNWAKNESQRILNGQYAKKDKKAAQYEVTRGNDTYVAYVSNDPQKGQVVNYYRANKRPDETKKENNK